ncbi:SAM-dependent methyltransferase [Thermodesulfomicrobium sp. WS]|uniref:tRNA1(Val) (adenine(37)-N6)-methyltransferase n=1 Tax=Thermodesulfomicrobium sp. WS TaxID=3004129 RepID=UPI0024924451|nr:methyltransferase [Thermodesulfomicrobium sp. WS]BDV01635.1 SAM-dependent methyltransferase [Thermodesulfomicrobium sp. WS]
MTFPRGLLQPAAGYRFSLDALLLAAFARPRGRVGLDLGAGCGVVGLGVLVRAPHVRMLAVEQDAELCACAAANAARLGAAQRLHVLRADVRRLPLAPESVDFVLGNPPYRCPGTGKVSPHPMRRAARFESGATLADFLRAASWSVRNRGGCWFVFLAERLDELLAGCLRERLRPKELVPVVSRPGTPARLVLLRAVKNGGPGLTVHAPLALHSASCCGPTPQRFSASARQFCPWLEDGPEDGPICSSGQE